MAWVSHMRAHVRRGEAIEKKLPSHDWGNHYDYWDAKTGRRL
jgi:hypothetical protein